MQRPSGSVTAPTGAAVRDINNIAQRRNPYVQLILYPALVQGEGAAQSIVNGIHAMEQLHPDLLIVGRGGGSSKICGHLMKKSWQGQFLIVRFL